MAFLLLVGAVAYGALRQQNAALEDLARTRLHTYEVSADAAQEVTAVHSNVYRLITWLSGLKEDRIRQIVGEQKLRIDAVAGKLAALVAQPGLTEAERQIASQAAAELGKYRQSVESAIDLSAGDTLTGATAMQMADKQFQAMQKHFDALVQLEKKLADASYEAAAGTSRLATGTMLAITAAALLASAAIAWLMSGVIVRPLRTAIASAGRIAQGDLSETLHTGGSDETGQLLAALAEMTQQLRRLVGEVALGARAVSQTSAQIAQGNLDLSQRTEEQASTLEETASSIEELTATVNQNAENARQASQLALGASQIARQGGEVVEQVVRTMSGISAASGRIADIIGVIDGIAFQTNILALNAAVEAARAGEQGRGFAVVAAEVRNLAQRSATAAKEIKALIGDSAGRVDAGAKLVDTAGRTMQDIVRAAKEVSDLVADIAAASEEQGAGIRQVNIAIAQMDGVVQQNAALVEEGAAATESMKAQACTLSQSVARFKLEEGEAGAADGDPQPARIRLRLRSAAPATASAGEHPQASVTDSGDRWQTS
ncbi:HAMP domain-containing protein [Ramlibacter alkalitolerans]|uniref:HAMP domain-containing protein n=1 Tax=Ramlibacter alkalitolerans TaxID=2039631 RepID=A0ABS1JVD3_9BURK|nr:HAMP domain-containing protein [Ramlibacter alkalitolerans]